MRLLLTVLGPQRSTLGDRSTHIFDETGGTFGRSASCDWTLLDERNRLSGRHASVSYNGRGFLITDTSTNGVYLNTVDVPLGRDQSAPLATGDTIYVADYIISVAILPEDAPRPSAPAHAVAMPVFAAPLPAAAPPTFVAAPAAVATRPALPPLADLTVPAPIAAPPAAFAAQPQPALAIAPGTPPSGLIPDDFDFSDLAPPQAVPTFASPPGPSIALPQPVLQAPMPVEPSGPPAAAPSPASAPLDALAMLRQRAMARAATIDLTPQDVDPARPRAMFEMALPGAAGTEGEASAFWQALGVDATRIAPEARERLLAELGAALREAAAGLVAVLSARKTMKDEFRVDQTRLAPNENNPFKFFASGDEALQRVIVDSTPGFLPLDFAVKQCFSDIQAHEVAIASAMQNGIRNLLVKIAPATVESRAEPGLLGRRPDKGKLWDQYGELHAELVGDLDRTIRDVVSDEFARASSGRPNGGDAR